MTRLQTRITSIALRNYLRRPRARQGNFVVSGYPKSGTTWVTQLAARLSGLNYRQGEVRFRLKGVVLHTHSTAFAGVDNILYAIRDPRESICSAARAMQARNRSNVFDQKGQITDDFVTYAMTTLPGARQSMRDHLQAGLDGGWAFVRFEDLKREPQAALAEVVACFGWPSTAQDIEDAIAAFDFSRQKARNRGNAFFAQSALASWTGSLNAAALDRLEAEVGPQARSFGYDLSQRPNCTWEG